MKLAVSVKFYCFSLIDFVFVHGNGEISIPIGQDSTTFMLNMTDDMLVEGIEDSVLVISSPDIESIAPDNVVHMNETTVFIVDNDGKCRVSDHLPNG